MNLAEKSIFAFGIYLILLGCTLIPAPEALLVWFGLPSLSGPIGPILGTLIVVLGFLCLWAARAGWNEFFRWTIQSRCGVFMAFGTYVLLGLAPPALLLFGTVDFLSAVWTAHGLRSAGEGGV